VAQDIINMLLNTLWPKIDSQLWSGDGGGVGLKGNSAVLNPVYILVIFGKRHFAILHSSTLQFGPKVCLGTQNPAHDLLAQSQNMEIARVSG